MRRWALSFLAIPLLVCALSRASAQDAGQPRPRTYTYREIGGETLRAHVFLPPDHDAKRPANGILLFHGGGWSSGSPEWTFVTAQRFANRGLVAISVQYRLSEGKVTPIEALEDVCAALAWARAQAETLGLSGRIAGYGVSAGGHLIALAGARGCGEGIAGPDALLLWSPAVSVTGDRWFAGLLQGRAKAAEYSPVEFVGRTTPPTCIVTGAKDTLTPLSGAESYCRRLTEAGGRCDLHVYPGLGHLLTRNLENQESDFDPDPEARADGIKRQIHFLESLEFIPAQ